MLRDDCALCLQAVLFLKGTYNKGIYIVTICVILDLEWGRNNWIQTLWVEQALNFTWYFTNPFSSKRGIYVSMYDHAC